MNEGDMAKLNTVKRLEELTLLERRFSLDRETAKQFYDKYSKNS